jgi:hypothetical protein
MTTNSERANFLAAWQTTFNDRDWDTHCAMYADDIVFSVFPGTTVLHGKTELRNALEGFTSRFPDIELTVQRSVTEGDTSAVQWDETGTEPESGDSAVFHFCGVIEFKRGIIANVARYGSRQP